MPPRGAYIGTAGVLGGGFKIGAVDWPQVAPPANWSLCDGKKFTGTVTAQNTPYLSDQTTYGTFNALISEAGIKSSQFLSTSDPCTGNWYANGVMFGSLYNAASSETRVYASSDGGVNWTNILTFTGASSGETCRGCYFNGYWYVSTVRGSGTQIWRSTAATSGWASYATPGTISYMSCFVSGGYIFTGGFNGKYSSDGTTWNTIPWYDTNASIDWGELIDGSWWFSAPNRSELYKASTVNGTQTVFYTSIYSNGPRIVKIGSGSNYLLLCSANMSGSGRVEIINTSATAVASATISSIFGAVGPRLWAPKTTPTGVIIPAYGREFFHQTSSTTLTALTSVPFANDDFKTASPYNTADFANYDTVTGDLWMFCTKIGFYAVSRNGPCLPKVPPIQGRAAYMKMS